MSVNRAPLITPDELTNPLALPRPDWQSGGAVDLAGLEAELGQTVEGEVRFDAGSKAMYAVDASNYRQVPIGVVIPNRKKMWCKRFRLAAIWRAGALAWRRYQSCRRMLQCRNVSSTGRNTCTGCWRSTRTSAGRSVLPGNRSATNCVTASSREQQSSDLGP